MNEVIGKLSPQLFWDVDSSTIDLQRNAPWLISRVVQRGTWEDWLLVSQFYGKKAIHEYLPGLKVDKKSAHFLTIYCSKS